MIYGIGTDLLDASRMRRSLARFGQRLPERLLHEAEWDGFRTATDPAHFLARSFAVKEAAAKAMGTGIRGFALHELGCLRDRLGKPELVFSGRLLRMLKGRGIAGGYVSLSDEGELVLAFVVLERVTVPQGP